MELILKQDVEGLGFKDDVVTVKNGYGRNFLIPGGKAILATSSAKKVLAENLKQRVFKEKKIIEDAQKVAEAIKASWVVQDLQPSGPMRLSLLPRRPRDCPRKTEALPRLPCRSCRYRDGATPDAPPDAGPAFPFPRRPDHQSQPQEPCS